MTLNVTLMQFSAFWLFRSFVVGDLWNYHNRFICKKRNKLQQSLPAEWWIHHCWRRHMHAAQTARQSKGSNTEHTRKNPQLGRTRSLCHKVIPPVHLKLFSYIFRLKNEERKKTSLRWVMIFTGTNLTWPLQQKDFVHSLEMALREFQVYQGNVLFLQKGNDPKTKCVISLSLILTFNCSCKFTEVSVSIAQILFNIFCSMVTFGTGHTFAFWNGSFMV